VIINISDKKEVNISKALFNHGIGKIPPLADHPRRDILNLIDHLFGAALKTNHDDAFRGFMHKIFLQRRGMPRLYMIRVWLPILFKLHMPHAGQLPQQRA
jgi:hypothetical protein